MTLNKDPEDELAPYRAKAAANGADGGGRRRGRGTGTGGSGGPGGYKPGQNVICKILKPESGGYTVIIVKDNRLGYLPSNARHNIGDDVLTTFVCVDKGRMLLSERFTHGKGDLLRNPDLLTKDYGISLEHLKIALNKLQFNELRCATNLIMPPLNPETQRVFQIQEHDVDWLVTHIETGMQTGCVKTSTPSLSSESAILLYKGRAVGCIHRSPNSEPKSTEEALKFALSDLDVPDTVVTVYDLPSEIVIAMSSLFLGYPVERHDDFSNKEYFDYARNWLNQKNATATIVVSDSGKDPCLCFIFQGGFVGAFDVESQSFVNDLIELDNIVINDPHAVLEMSMSFDHKSWIHFGFNLSMHRERY